MIRPEEHHDVAGIRALHLAAFPGEDEANLVDKLRENGRSRASLVAEEEGRVVGHIVFSPVTVESPEGACCGLGLAPLAVLPEFQRRGIGAALVRAGLEACRQEGCPFVVLLGHPEYYPRFGFRRASDRGIANEYGADEAFMVLELQPDALPAAGGLATYGPEFGVWS